MAYEHTEGIVLRKVDFSETSRIVTFLTPERGRLACMVKGVRRKGSAMASLLDTYNHLEITYTWRDSRQVQLLTEATMLDAFSRLKHDMVRIACAAFLLETAGLAAQENDPAPVLFHALCTGLRRLDAVACDPCDAAAHAVYATLDAAGFAPDSSETLFAEQTHRLSRTDRDALLHALESLAQGDATPNTVRPALLFRYFNEYATYQFERAVKSYAFLASLLEEGG